MFDTVLVARLVYSATCHREVHYEYLVYANRCIMYRVPEDSKACKEERYKADKRFATEMCEEVFGVSIGNEDISKQFRLGSFPNEDKVRPLLVSFNHAKKKETILNNLRNPKLCGGKFKF